MFKLRFKVSFNLNCRNSFKARSEISYIIYNNTENLIHNLDSLENDVTSSPERNDYENKS